MSLRVVVAAAAALLPIVAAHAADPQVERGKYLVTFGGCTDCHTPGHFLGHPDMARYLGGSHVGFGIPGLGVFVGSNLTPDKETGLGSWSAEQIVTAITTGKTPDGRILGAIDALARICRADQAGRAGDRGVSEIAGAGQLQGAWSVRPKSSSHRCL